ncbi:uncharacterized protein [Diabrotica undecimpunctata]|uniref:uncharacterized protein n=1 Tax=Diabrotica undecimpunctata TaxID=50387 RepID=UPI003B6371B7
MSVSEPPPRIDDILNTSELESDESGPGSDGEFQSPSENLQPQLLTQAEIDYKEVARVCQALKNRKSPGPGNIPPELLKYGTSKLYKQLASLYQKCINGESIPKEWRTSFITTIHKKGSKDVCDNYRGIAVLSNISRVYGKLIKKRIEDEFCDMEAEEQAGFRAALEDLYKNNTNKIKKGQEVSKGFTVSKGLKQGYCVSPTLFKIYSEQTMKTWKIKCRNMGISLNDAILYTLSFANDQIVMA